MGQYYQNSLLTIAAVSAKNGAEGYFRNRNMLQVTPCPVPAQGGTLGDPSVDGYFIRPTWPPEQGEVLQFEKYQMTFNCYYHEASEQCSEGFQNNY